MTPSAAGRTAAPRLIAAALGFIAAWSAPAAAGPLGRDWQHQAFAKPAFGASSWTNNGQTVAAASLGVRAGFNYWELSRRLPRLQGQTRVAGDYLLSASDLSGWEMRVGSFLGPAWRHVGLSFGPDFFRNQYTVAGFVLEPTSGVSAPLLANASKGDISAYVGVEPSWYFGDARPGVNWAKAEGPAGFGDEFRYLAGASVGISELRVGVNYQYRITSGGNESGFGLALGYNPPATKGKVKGGKKKGGKGKKS
jgi:hypothetical protein